MIQWGSPWFFALLVLVALRLGLLYADRRDGLGSFVFSSVDLVAKRRSLRVATAWLPMTLEVLGWTLLIIALAQPQRVLSVGGDDRQGVDIVVALDASGSMAAEDYRPRNRFTVAKELISEFIEGRVNDRIGIVTFGSRAATRVPVTYDREVAAAILSRVQLGENGDGTAIGHALATAVNRLRNSKARGKVIVLVTDGVSNAGSIEPTTAAGLAARFGIKVYTVGVGGRGEVPMPVKVQNRFTGEIETVYQYVRVELDEELLAAIARATGGAYFQATDARTLARVFNEIDKIERTALAAPRRQRVDELYRLPLGVAIGLLLIGLTAGETLWTRLPA